MSLMRLLTSGKTLVGLHGAPRQYRMSDPRAMPSFNEGQDFYSRLRGEGGRSDKSGAGVRQVELVQMDLGGGGEAPSTKIQAPEKLQDPSTTIQRQEEASSFSRQASVKVEELPKYE